MADVSQWETVKLGEAGRWLSGGTPLTTNPDYWDGDIPWISSGSLTSFRLHDSDRRVTELGSRSGTRVVNPGTILMVVRGMSLKTEFRLGLAQREMTFGQDCKALVSRSDMDASFLAYAIAARQKEVLGLVDEAGHGTGRLNTDQLFAVEILRPPMMEQTAIVRVLEALDDKIAANATLTATAEGLMITLASLAPAVVEVNAIASHSTSSVRPESFDVKVAHFSLPAFDVGVRPETAVGLSIKSNKFAVTKPSVLMSKLNPRIPRIWNVPLLPAEMALASTEFVVLQPTEIDTSELWSALSHPDVSADLTGKVAGTSGSHQRVKPAEILGLRIRDPRTLPDRVRGSITRLGLIAHQRRAESARLANARDALLPQLMSGRIRVKDAEHVVEGVV